MKSNYEILKFHKYICLELKHQRQEKKLTQEKVAYDLGIPASYLSNIENGKRKSTSLVTYMKIANCIDVDLSKILYIAEKKMELDETI
ncbi:helix-turn-helix domain-containing protein (plasmid) [Staphylococcus xylosus]|uniref:helix-turn-helix domain-containing protein n=1 Tax=Staphylococcus xylosus TaxID=1288 RepID=UPI002DB64D52|nr:helix-turn-helix transcriptional regulator [Staphylococcus xylosus]MEB8122969.1 helix-turn-helix transcriptional regulator [Staphylococcus xylosus]